jgi:hypothetical protein
MTGVANTLTQRKDKHLTTEELCGVYVVYVQAPIRGNDK